MRVKVTMACTECKQRNYNTVKNKKNTPDKLYEEMGRFFFTPGVLTPSLFNDDALFEILEKHGVDREDLAGNL